MVAKTPIKLNNPMDIIRLLPSLSRPRNNKDRHFPALWVDFWYLHHSASPSSWARWTLPWCPFSFLPWQTNSPPWTRLGGMGPCSTWSPHRSCSVSRGRDSSELTQTQPACDWCHSSLHGKAVHGIPCPDRLSCLRRPSRSRISDLCDCPQLTYLYWRQSRRWPRLLWYPFRSSRVGYHITPCCPYLLLPEYPGLTRVRLPVFSPI